MDMDLGIGREQSSALLLAIREILSTGGFTPRTTARRITSEACHYDFEDEKVVVSNSSKD